MKIIGKWEREQIGRETTEQGVWGWGRGEQFQIEWQRASLRRNKRTNIHTRTQSTLTAEQAYKIHPPLPAVTGRSSTTYLSIKLTLNNCSSSERRRLQRLSRHILFLKLFSAAFTAFLLNGVNYFSFISTNVLLQKSNYSLRC